MKQALILVAVCGWGCVPDLTSPGGTTQNEPWVAPQNDWPMAEPPADLVGEGFSAGQVLPDIRLTDQKGQEVSAWQFYGSVIVVDVSTIWCGPCQDLAADVEETYHAFLSQEFMYLTLLPEDLDGEIPDTDDLNFWADTFGITAPVLSDDEGHSYEIAPDGVYPRIMVVDREMRVADDQVIPASDARIRDVVSDTL